MKLFKNKYRIETTRFKGWDYSSDGYYFITICTKNREYLFGDVADREMILSEIGSIVNNEWLKSFEIRKELFCDQYCIMPDHIHGIVVINKNGDDDDGVDGDGIGDGGSRDARPCVSTADRENETDCENEIQRLPRSISSFVAGFKSSATKIINESRNTPGLPVWQTRFYDHIIRNENELTRIREYIMNNPLKWYNDKNNRGDARPCVSTEDDKPQMNDGAA